MSGGMAGGGQIDSLPPIEVRSRSSHHCDAAAAFSDSLPGMAAAISPIFKILISTSDSEEIRENTERQK